MSGGRRLLHALRLGGRARPLRGRGGVAPRGLPHRPDLRSSGQFIERKRGRRSRSCSRVHYTAPHWPWETRADATRAEAAIERISHFDGGSVETYLEMIRAHGRGHRPGPAALEGTGARTTRSSCSPATTAASASPTPGRSSARRWTCSRAGSACPTSCAGRRASGRRRHPQLAITMDWVATFLDAADVAPHPDYPLDGVSLLLSRARAAFERELFWRMKFRNQKAMRSRPVEVPFDRRRRVPVRPLTRPARARQPRPPRARAPGRDARPLRRLGSHRSGPSCRRHVQHPLHQGRPRPPLQLNGRGERFPSR